MMMMMVMMMMMMMMMMIMMIMMIMMMATATDVMMLLVERMCKNQSVHNESMFDSVVFLTIEHHIFISTYVSIFVSNRLFCIYTCWFIIFFMFSCSCHTKFVFRFVKVVCDWVDRSLWNDAVRAKPKLRFSPTAIASGCSAIQRFRGRIAFGEVEIFQLRFQQCCANFVVSGRSVLGCQKVCGTFLISSLNLSPSSSPLSCIFFNSVSLGVFRHCKVVGAKWHFCIFGFFAANGFRLLKGSSECSPKQFFTLVSPAVFLGKWLLLQKRFRGGFRQNILHLVSPMSVAS